MRSSTVVAGLVAVAYADSTTVTTWEDVTVTYCAPSATKCIVSPSATYTSGWENWQSAAEPGSNSNTWAAYGNPAQSTNTWAAYGNPAQSTNTWSAYDPSEPEATGWANVPEGDDANTWSAYEPADATWSGYPAAPAGTDAAQTWADVPADAENTWSGYPAVPAVTETVSWKNVPVKPTPVAGETTWSTWAETSTLAVPCPSYTATGPPSWFSNLPSDVANSLAAKWTGAPPMDWCYYSYSTTPAATQTSTIPAASTWAVITSSVPAGASTWAVVTASSPAAASTGAWQNVNAYKGAANAQAGSVAMAGLAGLAAIMLA